jgi:hypothetical protein
MRVESSHHIDSSEPDEAGLYEWRYEYDLIKFIEAELVLVARSYADSPEEAHLLRIEERNAVRGVTTADLSGPLAVQAIAYLRNIGKKSVNWLGSKGYVAVS